MRLNLFTRITEQTSTAPEIAAPADGGVMPASMVRAGDHYVTGSGRLVEIGDVIRGNGQVRIALVDGWTWWVAGSDMVRISR